jgi:hypothetical protein
MGNHAEFTARTGGIERRDQDRFAELSQQRAAQAVATGAFQEEIVPVPVIIKGKETLVSTDERPRPETTLDALARLNPAFQTDGTVTAGNSSMLSDGAAALVVADGERPPARPPLKARIVAVIRAASNRRRSFVPHRRRSRSREKGRADPTGSTCSKSMRPSPRRCWPASRRISTRQGQCARRRVPRDTHRPPVARVLVTLLAVLKQRDKRYGVASCAWGRECGSDGGGTRITEDRGRWKFDVHK